MRGSQAQAAWLGFRVLGECLFEAELAFVLAVLLEGVDEEDIGAAGGENPAAVSGDVEADDRFAERRDVRFGVDAETVEHANVALVGGNGDITLFCGSRSREVVFGDVLFQFRIDEFVAGYTWVDAVEGIAGETEECLLIGHLGEFLNTKVIRTLLKKISTFVMLTFSGANVLTGISSCTFHSSTTLPYSRSIR